MFYSVCFLNAARFARGRDFTRFETVENYQDPFGGKITIIRKNAKVGLINKGTRFAFAGHCLYLFYVFCQFPRKVVIIVF